MLQMQLFVMFVRNYYKKKNGKTSYAQVFMKNPTLTPKNNINIETIMSQTIACFLISACEKTCLNYFSIGC